MLIEEHRALLKQFALRSIEHGLATGHALAINADDYAPELRQRKATFVTLHLHQQLRGCIGMLEPVRPLVEDTTQNAWSAAFRDPRFPALQACEAEQLDLHISILGEPEVMEFTSEENLIEQIRPGVDGLILEEGQHRGTFLPSVWESLPYAADFVSQLKVKAGLSPNYWSNTLSIQRYTVEEF